MQSQYRLEVLLDERQATEVLAGEVLPPRHLLPVRASSLQPRHARAVNTPISQELGRTAETKQGRVTKRRTMNATAGSAERSDAATSAAAPALARWKCTEERAGVDVAGGAAPARAGGDGPSLRAPRMAMAVSFSFRAACFCFRLGYVRGCVLSVLSVLWCCLGLASQPNPRCLLPFLISFCFCWTEKQDQNPLTLV